LFLLLLVPCQLFQARPYGWFSKIRSHIRMITYWFSWMVITKTGTYCIAMVCTSHKLATQNQTHNVIYHLYNAWVLRTQKSGHQWHTILTIRMPAHDQFFFYEIRTLIRTCGSTINIVLIQYERKVSSTVHDLQNAVLVTAVNNNSSHHHPHNKHGLKQVPFKYCCMETPHAGLLFISRFKVYQVN